MPSKLYFLLWQRMLFTLCFSARCWYLFSVVLDCEPDDRTPLWFSVQCHVFPLRTTARKQAARSLQHNEAGVSWKKTSVMGEGIETLYKEMWT